MERKYEDVAPEALGVGDLVKGNGALWCILSFGKWGYRTDGGRCEFITVECVDPLGVQAFKVGTVKQFALYPLDGAFQKREMPEAHRTWTRVARPVEEGAPDLRRFSAGVMVEDAQRHCGRVVEVVGAHKVRVRWHKGFASIEDVDRLRIVDSSDADEVADAAWNARHGGTEA